MSPPNSNPKALMAGNVAHHIPGGEKEWRPQTGKRARACAPSKLRIVVPRIDDSPATGIPIERFLQLGGWGSLASPLLLLPVTSCWLALACARLPLGTSMAPGEDSWLFLQQCPTARAWSSRPQRVNWVSGRWEMARTDASVLYGPTTRLAAGARKRKTGDIALKSSLSGLVP